MAVLAAAPPPPTADGGRGAAGALGASPYAWERQSSLAKLVTIATVCNKAQFAGEAAAAATEAAASAKH